MSYSMRKKLLYAYWGKGTAPRRSVTMNGEPILWKSQIRHLGNFITHDLSDLNDITYKKGVFISQVNRLNARFPFVSSGVKSHLLQTYCCSFYGCQTCNLYGKHVNQLNVEWNKAVRRTLNLPYKTHRRLLPLIVNGKSFKSQHCSCLHKCVNEFFFLRKISMFLSLVLKLKRGWRDHWGVTGPASLSWTALFLSTLRMSTRLLMRG